MTANDELRRMLDERGVWHEDIKDLQDTFDVSVVVGGVEMTAEYFEAEYMRELGIEVDG